MWYPGWNARGPDKRRPYRILCLDGGGVRGMYMRVLSNRFLPCRPLSLSYLNLSICRLSILRIVMFWFDKLMSGTIELLFIYSLQHFKVVDDIWLGSDICLIIAGVSYMISTLIYCHIYMSSCIHCWSYICLLLGILTVALLSRIIDHDPEFLEQVSHH